MPPDSREAVADRLERIRELADELWRRFNTVADRRITEEIRSLASLPEPEPNELSTRLREAARRAPGIEGGYIKLDWLVQELIDCAALSEREGVPEGDKPRLRAWLRLIEATTDPENAYLALHGYDAPGDEFIESRRVYVEHGRGEREGVQAPDPEFTERIEKSMDRNAQVLDRLAESEANDPPEKGDGGLRVTAERPSVVVWAKVIAVVEGNEWPGPDAQKKRALSRLRALASEGSE